MKFSFRNIIRKNKILILITAISIVGLFIRLWQSDFFSLLIDETTTGRTAIGILNRGYPSTIQSDKVIVSRWRGAIYNFQVALAYKLFGISDLTTRLPGILWGTLTIPIAYCFGKFFANKNTGFCFALLVTFLPWEIATSRYARFYAMAQAIYLLSFFVFYKWFSRVLDLEGDFVKKIFNRINLWLLLWFFLVGLGFYTHRHFSILMVFCSFTFALIWSIYSIIRNKNSNGKFIILFLVL